MMSCSHFSKMQNKITVRNSYPIQKKQVIHLQLNNDFPQAIHMISPAAKES